MIYTTPVRGTTKLPVTKASVAGKKLLAQLQLRIGTKQTAPDVLATARARFGIKVPGRVRAYSPDEERDKDGKWASGAGMSLPEKPGSQPIPAGHVRLYHQTSEANLDKIAKEGIRFDSARGIEGPKAVYADEHGFYGKPGDKPTVEFHVPQTEWDRTKPMLFRAIRPEEIVAVHRPWHEHARYILNDTYGVFKEAQEGKLDYLLTAPGGRGENPEGKAIEYLKSLPADAQEKYQRTHLASKGTLDAGGAGSGCHGPNCGRPAEGISQLYAKYPANPADPRERIVKSGESVIGTFQVVEREQRLRIKSITATEPGNGVGSLILRRILRVADANGLTTELTASPFGAQYLEKAKLVAWYARYGFVAEPGYDEALGYMIRPPAKEVKAGGPGSGRHKGVPSGSYAWIDHPHLGVLTKAYSSSAGGAHDEIADAYDFHKNDFPRGHVKIEPDKKQYHITNYNNDQRPEPGLPGRLREKLGIPRDFEVPRPKSIGPFSPGVYAAFNPDEARDDKGKWTTGGANSKGNIFVSPNTAENLTFDQAQQNLKSDRQNEVRKMAAGVVREITPRMKIADVIGDWSDGAENSLLIHADIKDPEQLRYAAARMGLEADQKAVIPFSVSSAGKDALWTIRVNHNDLDGIRDTLGKSGLQFRTLEPQGSETLVHVFDPGTMLKRNVQTAAKALGGRITVAKGTGEFLGSGDSREEGKAEYRKVIQTYERKKLPLAAAGRRARCGYDFLATEVGRKRHYPDGTKASRQGKKVNATALTDYAMDYYQSGVSLRPVSNDHPPSLRNPQRVKQPIAQDGWHRGASKAARKKAMQDLMRLLQLGQNQPGIPSQGGRTAAVPVFHLTDRLI